MATDGTQSANLNFLMNPAQKAGSAEVSLRGNNKVDPIKVTGSQVAAALGGDRGQGGAVLRLYSGSDNSGANATTDRTGQSITFRNGAMNESSRAQITTTLHEGMHLLDATRAWDPYKDDHQIPFRDAADGIYNLGKP